MRVNVSLVTQAVPVEFLRVDPVVVDHVLLDLMLVAEPKITLGALVDSHRVSVRPPPPLRQPRQGRT